VWNSHCTRVRFVVMVSRNDKLAVHSCPLLCLQRWVAKVASGLFDCWSSLRSNNMATNLQRFTLYYGGRRFVDWDCWTQTSWQVMQRGSDMQKTLPDLQLWAMYIYTLWKEAWVCNPWPAGQQWPWSWSFAARGKGQIFKQALWFLKGIARARLRLL